MSTYKQIFGKDIQTSISSDPTTMQVAEGQIWYNSTDGHL